MITIKYKNVQVLTGSLKFNDDNTKVIFQANADLYVDGNTYSDLYTTKTIFNLTCLASEISDIQLKAEEQVAQYININYPPIE